MKILAGKNAHFLTTFKTKLVQVRDKPLMEELNQLLAPIREDWGLAEVPTACCNRESKHMEIF